MIKSNLIFPLLFTILSLFSCNKSTEQVCSKIKINNNEITLKTPFYKLKGQNVIYGDVKETSKYLGGNAGAEEKETIWVTFDGFIVMFENNKSKATKAIIQTQQFIDYDLSGPVRGKTDGLDIPVDDYVDKILGFQHKIENGVYVITK